jgi:metal-responsive CopG/Arc/MetJ family transcriptional regulator
METTMLKVSVKKDMLNQIDQIAKFEFRSRAELIREAARLYIERKQKWQNIFAYGSSVASQNDILEKDVMNEIKQSRQNK